MYTDGVAENKLIDQLNIGILRRLIMKVTKKMVDYWIGEQSRKLTIKDYTDLANGDYSVKMLKEDIITTWNENPKEEKNK